MTLGTSERTKSIAIITLKRFIPLGLLINFFKTTPPIAHEFADIRIVEKK